MMNYYDEIKNRIIDNEIFYYTVQVKKRRLTKRQLENIVRNKEYDRLDDKTKNKLSKNIELYR